MEFSLVGLINKRLISVVLKVAGISDLRCPVVNLLQLKEREKIVKILTDWRSLRCAGLKVGLVHRLQQGGVSTAEINEKNVGFENYSGLIFCR